MPVFNRNSTLHWVLPNNPGLLGFITVDLRLRTGPAPDIPALLRRCPGIARYWAGLNILPGYSRWPPVVLNILKQPGLSAGSSWIITVHPGHSRCRHGCAPGCSRLFPVHQTGTYRGLKPGQWECSCNIEFIKKRYNCFTCTCFVIFLVMSVEFYFILLHTNFFL